MHPNVLPFCHHSVLRRSPLGSVDQDYNALINLLGYRIAQIPGDIRGTTSLSALEYGYLAPQCSGVTRDAGARGQGICMAPLKKFV